MGKTLLKLRAQWWPIALIPFLGYWVAGLTDIDEGYYGAVIAGMLRTGDFLTPRLNGVPWFEKPILLYWLAAPSTALFGEAFGPRLPSVLANLGTAWLLSSFARRHWRDESAWWAPVVFCSSLLVALVGRMLLTDSLFVFSLTFALVAAFESRERPKLALLCGLGVGLGMLAKGPVAVILVVGVLLVWRWISPKPERRVAWIPATLVCLAVISAWYVPAWLANREVFVRQFLIEQNLMRFAGGDLAHKTPAWLIPVYFPAVIMLGFSPYWFWRSVVCDVRRAPDPSVRFLAVWAAVVLLFFSFSGSKLPHYIFPAFAPLALLVGRAIARARLSRSYGLAAAVGACALVGTGFLMDYENRFASVHSLAKWLRTRPGTVYVYRMGRQGDSPPTMKLQVDESSHPSLSFYLGRDYRTADEPDELASAEPGSWVIARTGRIGNEESGVVSVRRRLERVAQKGKYELYRIEAR